MREFTSVTKPHEPSVLSTYSMKVGFFKELAKHPAGTDWRWKVSPSRVRNILKFVHGDGLRGLLTAYFIENEPVLMESDRGYLEVRRITKEMHVQMETDYFYSLGAGLYQVVMVFSFGAVPGCVREFRNTTATAQQESEDPANYNTSTGYHPDTNSLIFKVAFHVLIALTFSVGTALVVKPVSKHIGRIDTWAHIRHFLFVIAMSLGPVFTFTMATVLRPRYSYGAVFLIMAVYNGIFVSLPHKKHWHQTKDVLEKRWIGGKPHGIDESGAWRDLYAFYRKHMGKQLHGSRWTRFKHWLTTINRDKIKKAFKNSWELFKMNFNEKQILTAAYAFLAMLFLFHFDVEKMFDAHLVGLD